MPLLPAADNRAPSQAAAPDRATLEGWDDAHLWHPFTPGSVYRDEEPLLIAAAEGNYLIDTEGQRYLDGVASLWCNLFGHRHPAIDAAILAQLGRIAHSTLLGNANVPAVELARQLIEIAPAGLSRVFFSDDGSTAVEVALKMALQYWQQVDSGAGVRRRKFLTLGNAYHGDTVGAVSLGGIDLFHARYGPLLFETLRSASPYCYRCPLGLERSSCDIDCFTALERLALSQADSIAAIVLEGGVQGAAGMIVMPEGFLRRARDLADRIGALLIVDEVATGFGRSGEMFVSQELRPDLLCLAKGLTGGYLPMAATLTTEAIYSAFLGRPEQGRTFYHGHTYTGNALGAAAALATLELLRADDLLPTVRARIVRLTSELNRLKHYRVVGDIRQFGLAAGIELVQDRSSRAPFPAADRNGMRVCRAARRKGVFLRPLGDTIVLMPPLSVTDAEIVSLVDAVAAGLEEITE